MSFSGFHTRVQDGADPLVAVPLGHELYDEPLSRREPRMSFDYLLQLPARLNTISSVHKWLVGHESLDGCQQQLVRIGFGQECAGARLKRLLRQHLGFMRGEDQHLRILEMLPNSSCYLHSRHAGHEEID